MKTILHCLLFASLSLFIGCATDDDTGGSGSDGSILAETLPCRIEGDLTLTDRNPNGADYLIDCRELEIFGGRVTVEPGTTIQLTDGSSVEVAQGGRLAAVGTADAPIRFVGTSGGTDPSWGYLYFNSSNAGNRLEHVLVENGGAEDLLFFERTAIALQGKLAMNHVTVRYSGGNGLTSNTPLEPVEITEFRNNIFADNDGAPVSVTPNEVGSMDLATCIFTDNGDNVIRVGRDVSANARLGVESTWPAAPVPYNIYKATDILVGLTVEAGAELVFNSGAYLDVVTYSSDNPYLAVDGTADQPVIMRGEVSLPGAWPGLLVQTSNARNVFDHLDISDGGEIFNTLFEVGRGNITLFNDNARLTLNDCTSTRADCDVVLDNQLGEVELINNSPAITVICEN